MACPQKLTSQTRVRNEQRLAEVLDMRARGFTLKAIGEVLGCTSTNVCILVKRGLKRLQAEQLADVDQHRALELARLDRLSEKNSTGVESGDPRAIQTEIRISERRCKLMGLDAPVKVEHSGEIGFVDACLEADRRFQEIDISAGGSGDNADVP